MATAAEQTSPAARVTAMDLAELMTSFNEVTAKLESTHEHLRGEVSRLRAELKEANSELERSRRLAALGEMAAGIAHEIRNPLGSIGLYARILTQDLEPMPESQRSAVKITDAVRRLDAIVSDVLSFSREMRICVERTSPRRLVDDVIESVRPSREACSAHVELRRQIDPAADDAGVWCDDTLVHQAMVNVLENAIQAIREQDTAGVVSIGAKASSFRDRDGRRCRGVTLFVADSGPGVPESVIERMFNPFFTTRSTGTGLGLAIVHRIVDAHGGRVTVRNGVDRVHPGATVEISFPDRADAEARPAERRAGTDAGLDPEPMESAA